MVKRAITYLLAAAFGGLASFTYGATPGNTPSDLTALMQMQGNAATDAAFRSPFADLRDRSMREAAEAVGAQHGMIWESGRINSEVNGQSKSLDKIYNFTPLMLNGGMVVPPVIEQAQSEWTGNTQAARRIAVQYQIIAQARISPVPPNWRNWLLMPPMQALRPDPSLLPRTDAERALWASAVREGWDAGVSQADTSFEINLHRLQRDMTGMLLFLRLERQGVVSVPVLGQGRPTIEVSGRSLAIGQTKFRIEAAAQFNGASYWKPLVASSPVLSVSNEQVETSAERQARAAALSGIVGGR
jgi:defect-in-organelle-trafficking protein DotC